MSAKIASSRTQTVNVLILTFFLVPVNQRSCLTSDKQPNVSLIVSSLSSARPDFLSTLNQASHQFFFRNIQVQHNRYFLSTVGQHHLQRFCLGDGTRKSIENDTLCFLKLSSVHEPEYLSSIHQAAAGPDRYNLWLSLPSSVPFLISARSTSPVEM
jgi:hypothetical protein